MKDIKQIIREINQAFRESNGELFAKHCHDDVVWKMVGHEECYETKQGIIDFMNTAPMEVVITEDEAIVEGNRAACTGTMQMPNKDGSTFKGEYCDVYLFEDGLVKELNSFVVEIKE